MQSRHRTPTPSPPLPCAPASVTTPTPPTEQGQRIDHDAHGGRSSAKLGESWRDATDERNKVGVAGQWDTTCRCLECRCTYGERVSAHLIEKKQMEEEASPRCFFNGCANHTVPGYWACYDHRDKPKCQTDDCHNMVYARKLCVLHGGKRACAVPGCGMNRRNGMYCSKHAPQKKHCSEPGCKTQAHLHGKCVRHGGGRICKIQGCSFHARYGPHCGRHHKELFGPRATSVSATMASTPTSSEGDSNQAEPAMPKISQLAKGKAKAKRPTARNYRLPLAVAVAAPAQAQAQDLEMEDEHVTLSSPPPELLHLDLSDHDLDDC